MDFSTLPLTFSTLYLHFKLLWALSTLLLRARGEGLYLHLPGFHSTQRSLSIKEALSEINKTRVTIDDDILSYPF